MTKILVFGAAGGVGQHFVRQALDKGHAVRAFVRSPEKFPFGQEERLEVVKGDATVSGDVDGAVDGVDLVVSLLGNPGKPRKFVLIMDRAARNIVKAVLAMPESPRCLMISSVGVDGTSWFIRAMLTLIGGRKGFQNYEHAESILREAASRPEKPLSLAIIRPYALSDNPPSGNPKVLGPTAHFAKPISRQYVAAFFLKCITDTQWDGPNGVNIGG
jgi:nucleoside-diphosphate-sugar epimerase